MPPASTLLRLSKPEARHYENLLGIRLLVEANEAEDDEADKARGC